MAPKAQATKEKYINKTSPKFKKELYIKGQYQDNKKATGRMKIVYLDKDLVSTIYKELNTKTNPVLMEKTIE